MPARRVGERSTYHTAERRNGVLFLADGVRGMDCSIDPAPGVRPVRDSSLDEAAANLDLEGPGAERELHRPGMVRPVKSPPTLVRGRLQNRGSSAQQAACRSGSGLSYTGQLELYLHAQYLRPPHQPGHDPGPRRPGAPAGLRRRAARRTQSEKNDCRVGCQALR